MIILKCKTTGWRGQFLKYFQFSEKIRVFNLDLILTLHKICQNTGFPWPVFSRIRIVDSVLIRKNTGQRIPVFWYILNVIMYSSRVTFWCIQGLISNSLLLKDIQKALNSLEKILFEILTNNTLNTPKNGKKVWAGKLKWRFVICKSDGHLSRGKK